jgi:hypothetical protein
VEFVIETGALLHAAFYFRSASEEYDRYMKTSCRKMQLYHSESDPVQWFDETVVYSNINGGVGIFAAYNDVIFYSNGDIPVPE